MPHPTPVPRLTCPQVRRRHQYTPLPRCVKFTTTPRKIQQNPAKIQQNHSPRCVKFSNPLPLGGGRGREPNYKPHPRAKEQLRTPTPSFPRRRESSHYLLLRDSAIKLAGSNYGWIPACAGMTKYHHSPVLGLFSQRGWGGSESPDWSNSMDMPSGERMNAMCPSRGGRLMVTPLSSSFAHNS